MALPELLILDVGHGNCAVLHDTAGVAIIDCAPGTTLKETLDQLNITEISYLLISHADEDHVGGLVGMLQDPQITVHHVFINPDAIKRTDIWYDVRVALAEARKTKPTQVHPQLTSDLTRSLDTGELNVEVLGPSPELALGGVGGEDLQGRRLTANSLSAVIRVIHDNRRLALITGDLDWVGLQSLLSDTNDLEAEILVFPHHGGKPGGVDAKQFANELCSYVKPQFVVFSISRARSGFPRRDVIETVSEVAPQAHIACTQLSQECAADVPAIVEHLMDYPARGRTKKSCCAGTVRVEIGDDQMLKQFVNKHQDFILSIAPTMCRKKQSGEH